MSKTLTNFWRELKQAAVEWQGDKVTNMAAAFSYYAVFSIAPMLIVLIYILGVFFGTDKAQANILAQISSVIGDSGTEFIRNLLANVAQSKNGIFLTIISIIGLLFAASGLFGQLQQSLNTIWKVPAHSNAVKGFLIQKFLAFLTLFLLGLLFFALIVLSSVLTIVVNLIHIQGFWLEIGNLIVFIAGVTLLFGLIFRSLGEAKIAWSDYWKGAFVAAILFAIGKYAISFYLARSGILSAYGAAGSVALIMLWIYYSAQILFFGAEVTKVSAGVHEYEPEEIQNNRKDKRASKLLEQGHKASNLVKPAVFIGAITVLSLFSKGTKKNFWR